MKSDSAKDKLLQDKSLSQILHVLNQTPSYLDELSTELNIPKEDCKKVIDYLKQNKLIQEVTANESQSLSIYPLLLKKINSMTISLSEDQRKNAMRDVKFYFISQKGREFLQNAKTDIEKSNEVMNNEENEG